MQIIGKETFEIFFMNLYWNELAFWKAYELEIIIWNEMFLRKFLMFWKNFIDRFTLKESFEILFVKFHAGEFEYEVWDKVVIILKEEFLLLW